jgi:hypothetical protein
MFFNPLNAELNPICHLLTLLGVHHILHVSRIKVNCYGSTGKYSDSNYRHFAKYTSTVESSSIVICSSLHTLTKPLEILYVTFR